MHFIFLLIHLMHELAPGCVSCKDGRSVSACCGTSGPAGNSTFFHYLIFFSQICFFSTLFSYSLFQYLPCPPFIFPTQYNIHSFSFCFSPFFLIQCCFLLQSYTLFTTLGSLQICLLVLSLPPVFLPLIYFISLVFTSLSSLQPPVHTTHTSLLRILFSLSDSFRKITPFLFKS